MATHLNYDPNISCGKHELEFLNIPNFECATGYMMVTWNCQTALEWRSEKCDLRATPRQYFNVNFTVQRFAVNFLIAHQLACHMHVVVTGSSGFIGNALVPRLVSAGHSVTALSRIGSQTGQFTGFENISKVLVSDLCDMSETEFPACDAVIHLAGISHRKDTPHNSQYERVNYETTLHVAELAAANGCEHFIFMSTAKVHAESTNEAIHSDSPYAPPDIYSETKARAEQALFDLETTMKVTALRPPAVIGLPAKANFKHLMRLAKLPAPIPFPTPSNSRCFIGLENLCLATIHCMEHIPKRSKGYLIHDQSPISTAELVECIAEAHGRLSRQFPLPRSLFQMGNRTIHTIAGKNLLAPFYENFVIHCDQFDHEFDWRPLHTTKEQIRALFMTFSSTE